MLKISKYATRTSTWKRTKETGLTKPPHKKVVLLLYISGGDAWMRVADPQNDLTGQNWVNIISPEIPRGQTDKTFSGVAGVARNMFSELR